MQPRLKHWYTKGFVLIQNTKNVINFVWTMGSLLVDDSFAGGKDHRSRMEEHDLMNQKNPMSTKNKEQYVQEMEVYRKMEEEAASPQERRGGDDQAQESRKLCNC
nr:hypothetical protein Iba_chr14dCG4510 [Ipomoea batatas]